MTKVHAMGGQEDAKQVDGEGAEADAVAKAAMKGKSGIAKKKKKLTDRL